MLELTIETTVEEVEVSVTDTSTPLEALIEDYTQSLEAVINESGESQTEIILNDPAYSGSVPVSGAAGNQIVRLIDGLFVAPHSWQTSEW